MQCHHYDAFRCRSCSWLDRTYDTQLATKDAACRAAVDPTCAAEWLPPVASAESCFRNKAKMVVAGTSDSPTLGILDPRGQGVDLRDCGLHEPGLRAALEPLADFITRARLTPYDVPQRSGELKHLLVTHSPDDELMARFVVRSTEPLARIRKHLPELRSALPQLRVATVNVQPEHKAVLEGEREIVLTAHDSLPMRVNHVTLHLRPRSFFQTNTAVAAALYREAESWTRDLDVASAWDLYCGVGGFALHLGHGREVLGVEVSEEAVAAAEQARDELVAGGAALERVRFQSGDATAVSAGGRPDLVVVNPPRRGLGDDLCRTVELSGARWVLYSSCNPSSLARDLAALTSYAAVRARVFDMFPQTGHCEVLVLLERRPA